MADHFARAAGFAGEETTEYSMMPPPPPRHGGAPGSSSAGAVAGSSNAYRANFDATADTEDPTTTGLVGLGPTSTAGPAPRILAPSGASNAPTTNGRHPSAVTKVAPQRVLSREAAKSSSRPTSSQGGPIPEDEDEEEDESEELLKPRGDLTVANETTINSADASEWERHIKDAKKTAGVGVKQMQQRIDNLLQERDDLKIEVDMLRRQYNPDERASELIRLRQENIRITNHRITLSDLLTGQKKVIRDLQRQAKQMSSQNEGNSAGDRQLRAKIDELEEALRLVDSQRQEEQEARQAAEEEVEQVKNQLLELEQERGAVADELDQVRAEKEDLDQELYKLEKERDEAQEEQRAWQSTAQEHEARIEQLEQDAVAEQDQQHQRQIEEIEDELEVKTEELQRTQLELQEVRGQLESAASEADVFKGEVQAQRAADEERYNALRDELTSKETELMQLDEEHEELLQARKGDEEEIAELGARLDDLEKLVEEKENEVVECNREIAHQAEVIRQLEEEQDMSIADVRDAEQARSQLEEDIRAQGEHHEMKVDSFKQRLADAAAELADANDRLQVAQEESEQLRTKLNAYRERMKERNEELEAAYHTNAQLDEKVQELLSDLKDEERNRDSDDAEWEKKLEHVEDDLRKIIDERDDAIAGLEEEINGVRRTLQERDGDLEALQRALQSKESDLDQRGRTSATDQHSLQLEIDRLRRDLSRCEADLAKAREELDRKDDVVRDKTSQMNKMYSENCEYSAKLATETQTRLGLDERLATMKTSLKEMESALEVSRARAEQLERQRADEEQSVERSEGVSKRQVMERNGLLVTVNQHIVKILSGAGGTGEDSGSNTPRKSSVDPKPSTDFGAFHGVLVGRLRKLSELKATFERRTQRFETNASERMTNMKRQQESRFRQLDRLEGALKSASDKQSAWRSRVVAKQSELDAAKGTISELQSQISSLKTRTSLASPADNSKLTHLTSRANSAEKKLLLAQSQATSAEDRLAEAKSKYNDGESKWLARIRELEARCKAAEEKVKRERQGAKERVSEQQEMRRKLESEVEDAKRRLKSVDEIQRGLQQGVE